MNNLDYESPITLFVSDMRTTIENDVFKVVQSYGFDVDKEELAKALDYDRKQYQKGYSDACSKIPSDYFLLDEIRKDNVDRIIRELYKSQKEKEDDSRGEN